MGKYGEIMGNIWLCIGLKLCMKQGVLVYEVKSGNNEIWVADNPNFEHFGDISFRKYGFFRTGGFSSV